MTLLSPLARSHQFVSWIFPCAVLLLAQSEWLGNARARMKTLVAAAVFYCLQALPYGKPAGMGTAANLILLVYFASQLLRKRAEKIAA